MKFKFLGKKDLRINTFTTNYTYTILNMETLQDGKLVIYAVDDNKSVLRIAYTSMKTFNENWRFVHD